MPRLRTPQTPRVRQTFPALRRVPAAARDRRPAATAVANARRPLLRERHRHYAAPRDTVNIAARGHRNRYVAVSCPPNGAVP